MSATQEQAGGILRLPSDCKPSMACSPDETRPSLAHGYLRPRADGVWLLTTDSYIACALRVGDVGTVQQGWVPVGVLRLLEQDSSYVATQVSSTSWRVIGSSPEWLGPAHVTMTLEVPGLAEMVYPDFDVIDVWGEAGKRAHQPMDTAHLDPRLMVRLGEALGVNEFGGCTFEFHGPNQAVRVRPHGMSDGSRVGLQMPLRAPAA